MKRLDLRSTANRPYENLVSLTIVAAAAASALLLLGAALPSVSRYSIPLGLVVVLVIVTVLALIQSRHRGLLNDLHAAVELEGALQRSGAKLEDFFYDGAAATSGLELLNLKTLLMTRPQSVLELGSGQSTKLLSWYAQQTPETKVVTLEQSEEWWSMMRPHVQHDYRHAKMQQQTWQKGTGAGASVTTKWYDFPDELRQSRFEYILVDGPDSGKPGTDYVPYSRSGVLAFVPQILAPSFVVVFDDAERRGESETAEQFGRILTENAMPYTRFEVRGVKTQIVFTSPDKAFLRSV